MTSPNVIFPKRESYFKLKDEGQTDAFLKTLFENRVPHESFPDDTFSISLEDKERFEQLGFHLEEAEFINLSTLSLGDRNAFKEDGRQHCLANRGQAIKELLKKYG
jgi:hypothetical protein